jgi:hypothetical protein
MGCEHCKLKSVSFFILKKYRIIHYQSVNCLLVKTHRIILVLNFLNSHASERVLLKMIKTMDSGRSQCEIARAFDKSLSFRENPFFVRVKALKYLMLFG